jgi:hypothetical protein
MSTPRLFQVRAQSISVVFLPVSNFLGMEQCVTAEGECQEYDGHMLLALELFFIGLLGLAGLSIAWISGIVVYKLFKGQR